ncbi:MAG: 2-dehydro-3-deoxyglucarate aldolase, partial [Chloroflexi bacterium]|nr:2-dehydro-3-deoxyglucarate aldolase [Chloroflexota bacterium]
VAEVLSLSGLDLLFIDMEHGALDIAAAQDLVRATVGDCPSLVRVPENSALWIRKVLDIGCDGIIIPLVRTAAEARQAVRAARYPPRGERSAGIARAHGYGLRFGAYVARADDEITVIVQVEHIAAVAVLDEILEVEGIDAILIGPYDLSGSMQRLGDVTHPDVQAAITTVRNRCQQRGMPVGIFVLDAREAAEELAQGADFLAVGTDASFLIAGAAAVVEAARHPAGPRR